MLKFDGDFSGLKCISRTLACLFRLPFLSFRFSFLISNAFQRDNNSDTVYVAGYIYMFLALLGVILILSWAQNVFVLTKK